MHCLVSNDAFLIVLTPLTFFFNCLASDPLLSPFHKKLKMFELMSLSFAKQVIRDLVSYLSKQEEGPI